MSRLTRTGHSDSTVDNHAANVKLPVLSFAEATVLSSIVTSVTIVFPVRFSVLSVFAAILLLSVVTPVMIAFTVRRPALKMFLYCKIDRYGSYH
jgi:hypothetical protein